MKFSRAEVREMRIRATMGESAPPEWLAEILEAFETRLEGPDASDLDHLRAELNELRGEYYSVLDKHARECTSHAETRKALDDEKAETRRLRRLLQNIGEDEP